MTSAPAPRAACHGYVIIDTRDPDPRNPTPVGVGLTRQACRQQITFDPDADFYRIRRAKFILYEK